MRLFEGMEPAMLEALSDPGTALAYHRRNAREEADASLSWGERLNAAWTGGWHGVALNAPEMFFRSGRTLARAVGLDDSWWRDGVEEWKEKRRYDPFYAVNPDWMKDGWGRSLYEGMSSLTASTAMMLPALLAAPLTKGSSLFLPLMVGATSGGVVASLSEYDSFMDQAYTELKEINPALTEETVRSEKFWGAFGSAAAEGGFEFAGDLLGGKVMGVLGKMGVEQASHVLSRLTRNVTRGLTVELGGELATAVVQDTMREWEGLSYEGRVEAMKNALGPALVGGAGFGVLGTAMETHRIRKNPHEVEGALAEARAREDGSPQSVLLGEMYRKAEQTPETPEGAAPSTAPAAVVSEGLEKIRREVDAERSRERTVVAVPEKVTEEATRVEAAEPPSPVRLFLGDDAGGTLMKRHMDDLMAPNTEEAFLKTVVDLEDRVRERVRATVRPLGEESVRLLIKNQVMPYIDHLVKFGERGDRKSFRQAVYALAKEGLDARSARELFDEVCGDGDRGKSLGMKFLKVKITQKMVQAAAMEAAARTKRTGLDADRMTALRLWDEAVEVGGAVRGVESELGYTLRLAGGRVYDGIDLLDQFNRANMRLSKQRLDAFVENHGGKAKLDAAAKAMEDAPGGGQERYRTRTPEEMDAVVEAAGGREKIDALATAMENVDDPHVRYGLALAARKVTGFGMCVDAAVGSMLTSPKTHVTNAFGNGINQLAEIGARFAGGLLDDGGKGVRAGEAWAMVRGLLHGWRHVKEVWTDHREKSGGTWKALKTMDRAWTYADGTKVAPEGLSADAQRASGSLTKSAAHQVAMGVKERLGLSAEHDRFSGGFSTMVEWLGRALGANSKLMINTDSFFKVLAFSAEHHALAFRKASEGGGLDRAAFEGLLNRPPPEMAMEAMDTARRLTFQEPMAKGSVGEWLDQGRHRWPLMRLFVPFLRTPLNLLKTSASFTPGMYRLFGDLRKQMNSPDAATRQLAEGRMMAGTFLWGSFMMMAAEGMLTGGGPSDPEERRKLLATGWQPNSLRIGGEYYGLDRMDPLAFIVNSAASLVEMGSSVDDADLGKAMLQGVGLVNRLWTSRSYMQGVNDLVDLFASPERAGQKLPAALARMAVPLGAGVRSLARQTDPVQREVEGFFDELRNGIPGLSMTLPERRNFLGEAVPAAEYLGPDFASPVRRSTAADDPVYDELLRLSKAGHGAAVSTPGRKLSHGGREIRLNGEQYGKYLELAGVGLKLDGKNAKEKLAAVMATELYREADDEAKARVVRNVRDTYRRVAKQRMLGSDPALALFFGR